VLERGFWCTVVNNIYPSSSVGGVYFFLSLLSLPEAGRREFVFAGERERGCFVLIQPDCWIPKISGCLE
jgi:hypothetical protein